MKAFLRTLPGKDPRSVVKPVQSAGSDDVFLCSNEEEALTAFGRISGTMNGIGLLNTCVLVQEYLKGKEYVIDKVSRDGVHKLVGIWEYEKRSVNGSNFVYFGMRLMDPSSEKMQIMVRYADQVLDALDIKHGPSHMEVMLDNWGTVEAPEYVPCLVEVGARCQGGEGTWLPMAKECIGYTPVRTILYTVCIEFKSSSRWERARYPATLPGTKHTLLHSLDVYFVFILYTMLTLYYILYTMQEGYDHSYFFISTFIDEHVEFHAKRLLA